MSHAHVQSHLSVWAAFLFLFLLSLFLCAFGVLFCFEGTMEACAETVCVREEDVAAQTVRDVVYLAASPHVAWKQLRHHPALVRARVPTFAVFEAQVSPPLEPSFVSSP